MVFDETDDKQTYLVLINDEEQYSLWPQWKAIPAGWRSVKEGSVADCVAFVDDAWTDMRPLSLRKKMAENASGGDR